jgi:hypothetical protein
LSLCLMFVSLNVQSWPVNKSGEQLTDEKLNLLLAKLIAMRDKIENDDNLNEEDWLLDDDLLNRLQHHAEKRSRQRFGETRSRVKELNSHPFDYDPEQQHGENARFKNVYEKIKVSNHLHQ